MTIGLDAGSTTAKCVVVAEDGTLLYCAYERHMGRPAEKIADLLEKARAGAGLGARADIAVTGSSGLGLSERVGLPFVQEVFATRVALKKFLPDADAAIELGGEDAKILFLTNGQEVRMNGSCAGGTGSFIDQMATLLNITPEKLGELALRCTHIYPIASRCGVFAKSDIQPLVNQGARTEDVCASILSAVVDQTVAGLAQGRPIGGNVAYLGGPLSFSPALRARFDATLNLNGVCPENALYYAALGAAHSAQAESRALSEVIAALREPSLAGSSATLPRLFESPEAREAFRARHAKACLPDTDPENYRGRAYFGVDSGSTTIKMCMVAEDEGILASRYEVNRGNPVAAVRDFLEDFYREHPNIRVAGSAATGYGEALVKAAFRVDAGLVETMAHYRAAKKLMPEVETIIDIGGQDIKCFYIKNGAVDNIFLNEACSSGCGSFLQTFASALGYPVERFAELGLLAEAPVNLGSRCTVFMNSSVKQAQKDGASVADISAGLSISVVKNALYKVIRAPSADALGSHIVVQGGTFLNDAVLRAFERETGREVVRPERAGLMGAYGAALYAKSLRFEKSELLSQEEIAAFRHEVKSLNCNGCTNHCPLTVNTFGGGRRFVGGNRCDKPVRGEKTPLSPLNLYDDKRRMLARPGKSGARGKIGLPLGLNLYELLPFWRAFFETLGFEVVVSPVSDRKLYQSAQQTIPSDTVCYPAKLMHGHVKWLCDAGVDAIFYPCMSYNLDERLGDNHYNCPVVAYYPEVLKKNMPELQSHVFLYPYVGLHKRREFPGKLWPELQKAFPELTLREVRRASDAAYSAYQAHMAEIRERGAAIIAEARAQGRPIAVLAGRPYHVDEEICHLIDRLVADYGVAVVSEDAVSPLETREKRGVLNQWTYHARLYAAAKYVASQPDMQLVQLVSFGCGVDAITTDEVREILEPAGKIYTQIKIDEIANLGAARIRLRSLFAAIEARKEEAGDATHHQDHTDSRHVAAAV